MRLSVYFGESLAGHLSSTAEKGIVFSYDDSYLDAGLPPISLSFPLSSAEYSQKQCLPFFEGLLPEGDVKRRISDYLHISETSTLKLLNELGGECAGMISILPEGEPNKIKNIYDFSSDNYEQIPLEKISGYIQNINTRPLLKVRDDLRLSLAGAQEKLPLLYKDGEFYLPRNGAPSTHIIKPTGSRCMPGSRNFKRVQVPERWRSKHCRHIQFAKGKNEHSAFGNSSIFAIRSLQLHHRQLRRARKKLFNNVHG